MKTVTASPSHHHRIEWVDSLRAVGIFFVILGHTPGLAQGVEKLIFSFHMPLFFWISGLLCQEPIHGLPFPQFFKSKCRKLLIPYLFFSIISYLIWLMLFRHVGSQAALEIPLWRPLIGIFYGIGIHHFMAHNTALWFFPALFLTESLFFLILKIGTTRGRIGAILIFAAMGYSAARLNPPIAGCFRLPWNMEIAWSALFFYGAGFFSKPWLMPSATHGKAVVLPWPVTLALCILYGVISLYNDTIAMVAGVYGNYLLFLSAALCGILFWQQLIVSLHRLLPEQPMKPQKSPHTKVLFLIQKGLVMIGQNTLTLFALHLLIFPLITGVQVYLFKIPAAAKQESWELSLIYTVLSIAVLLPISHGLNRYLPMVMGRGPTPTDFK